MHLTHVARDTRTPAMRLLYVYVGGDRLVRWRGSGAGLLLFMRLYDSQNAVSCGRENLGVKLWNADGLDRLGHVAESDRLQGKHGADVI